MIESFHHNIESTEKPHPKYLKVFRFRHGSSKYSELNYEVPTDEFDLTEEGKQEVIDGVNSIMKGLDKNNDIIVLVSSPKVRAKGSMQLAKNIFEKNGFTVWKSKDDTRLIRNNIRSGDTLDDERNPVEKGDQGFSEAQSKALDEANALLTSETDMPTVWANYSDKISGFEKFDDVGKRANKEIELLFKTAHMIQTKTEKQIVVISFEHGETVDPVVSMFGEGVISQKRGNPLKNGEPLLMDISTEDNSMKISLPLREDIEEEVINFNKKTKTFTKNENK